jgi:site-specific recombinase XerD
MTMTTAKPQSRLFFSETLDYLENYLPRQVGRSANTVKAYRDALTVFRRYLYEERGISLKDFAFGDCDKALILEFMSYLKEQGISPVTCNQRVSAIKSYVWFAADKDVLLQSVALSVSRVPQQKTARQVRPILSPEALSALFSAPADTKIGLRDRTILIVLYDSAIRQDELLSLTIGEASLRDPENSFLRIHGKGNKERIVAITTKTAEHMCRYIDVFHGIAPTGADYLFYAGSPASKRKMSGANVERIVKKYAAIARTRCDEVPDRAHPHMFRRTRATELYQNGVPLELISRMLGHASIETTKIYATPSVEMLRAAVNAVENPASPPENQLWNGSEDELARLYGLR